MDRPNLVFIVFDTARASAFEPWGASPGSTPTMAQLSSRGVAVPQAVSTCNWTMPSHAAMFTGRLPRSVGLTNPPGPHTNRCYPLMEANRGRLLPEVLHRAGYHTAASSANPWVATSHGFGIGFDSFAQVSGTRNNGIADRDWRTRLRWAYEALVARVDDGITATSEVIDGWLAEKPRQPFFWFINVMECHSPYLPPRPWNGLGPLDRLRASREARRHLTLDAIWRASAGGFDIPEETLERMRHLYARAVALMDSWLAQVLAKLDEHGLLDDTLVVATADHGENLGESRLIGHAFSLNDHLIRVPLVIAGPDPVEVPAVMSTAALPGVIAEALGLESNPWARDAGDRLEGIAVAQYDALCLPEDPRVEEAVDAWHLGDAARFALTQPMTAATDGHRKLVRHGQHLLLYDLRADPHELAPVKIAEPTKLPPDTARLYEALERADASDADPEAIRRLMSSDPGIPADEALEAQLRLLGYL